MPQVLDFINTNPRTHRDARHRFHTGATGMQPTAPTFIRRDYGELVREDPASSLGKRAFGPDPREPPSTPNGS